jgi:hypothetical protein
MDGRTVALCAVENAVLLVWISLRRRCFTVPLRCIYPTCRNTVTSESCRRRTDKSNNTFTGVTRRPIANAVSIFHNIYDHVVKRSSPAPVMNNNDDDESGDNRCSRMNRQSLVLRGWPSTRQLVKRCWPAVPSQRPQVRAFGNLRLTSSTHQPSPALKCRN